ncbi:MAG: RnfABCDGE type electron transport complex subunit B [Candidatus Omnitrophica bacterium]|nr:RnfABCDGE type electron transport complex subunit B [Candidatus Omnitrophota bacterium]MBU1047983.1 RnfABCDGE type electron transport complex subunit B [Candidatus Omnitrophota bacterium]MBU1631379.1 RnfABCDGE type electron transport complex subunit B [Candidatus Omnitrophota bacterium]MBU1767158.1 RnfABCDGE type electron transport complex subunit B [Candidatus Omnitrophota bacterium]MBU1889639.1 RnfABCDGE type electron transport complex subunit B [Candidatus Omnitrophota bacterium]
MMLLIYSIISMVALGLFFALILFIADKKLRISEDPKAEKVDKALVGLNCGACGYPSCRIAAEAIVKGEAAVDSCIVGGEGVATIIAGIMGKDFSKKTHKNIAVVHCSVDSATRQISASYSGIKSCVAANLLMQGGMACKYGCLGLGDCAKVCPVDAIIMKNGAPVIDVEKCISCGACVKACPRNIISLRRYSVEERTVYVACNNIEPGKQVRSVCKIGCIACGICQKLSEGVFEINNNLSRVNMQKAKDKKVDWDTIIQKCPTKCILEIK